LLAVVVSSPEYTDRAEVDRAYRIENRTGLSVTGNTKHLPCTSRDHYRLAETYNIRA